MQKKIERLTKRLEDALEYHRDGYNQALGGLHVLEALQKQEPDAITEEELGRALGAQTLSFDPVSKDGADENAE